MKAAIYVRVSVDKSSQTTIQQVDELKKYCDTRGWENYDVFEDRISGGKSQREGLDAMLKGIRKNKYKAVLISKVDRLARSMAHFTMLVDEFKKYGVALIIPSQGITTETDNPASQMLIQMLAVLGEFERNLASERIKLKLDYLKCKGVKLGRPKKIDDKKAKVKKLRDEGLSLRAIAEKTKISVGSVRNCLKA